MHREDHGKRELATDQLQALDDLAQALPAVHVLLPVCRYQEILLWREAQIRQHVHLPFGNLQILVDRIHNGVAGDMNLFLSNSFLAKVLPGIFCGSKKIIGNMISYHPVDLLRHGAIVAS